MSISSPPSESITVSTLGMVGLPVSRWMPLSRSAVGVLRLLRRRLAQREDAGVICVSPQAQHRIASELGAHGAKAQGEVQCWRRDSPHVAHVPPSHPAASKPAGSEFDLHSSALHLPDFCKGIHRSQGASSK